MNNIKKIHCFKDKSGVTIHPPKAIWEAMGFPEYIEFVLNADGTCKLVPRRLV